MARHKGKFGKPYKLSKPRSKVRNIILSFRVSKTEASKIHKLLKIKNINLSDCIREIIL